MLTIDELRALIADRESDRVELTVSTKNTDKFGEAICAFANDFPNHRQSGYLVVGVGDDGTASGLTVPYRSLMAMAHEARKPMFHLKAADGALGGHIHAVQDVCRDFETLATAVAARCGVCVSIP